MTVKQAQCLLAFLGYYSGAIDGRWGPASTKACEAFQAEAGLEADGVVGKKTEAALREAVASGEYPKANKPAGWDSVKYFTQGEFSCKCGKCGGFPVEPDMELVGIADRLREELCTPIIVSSGVRCKTHNAAVGGVSTSRHMMGTAMDFCAKGVSASNLLARVKNIPGIVYAYAIDGNYVHMDIGNK